MPLVERILRAIHFDHSSYGTAGLPHPLQNGILHVVLDLVAGVAARSFFSRELSNRMSQSAPGWGSLGFLGVLRVSRCLTFCSCFSFTAMMIDSISIQRSAAASLQDYGTKLVLTPLSKTTIAQRYVLHR
jgi:hypothetical protein